MGRWYLGDLSPVITSGKSQKLNGNSFPFPLPSTQVRVCASRERYPIIDLQLPADGAGIRQLLKCPAQPSQNPESGTF